MLQRMREACDASLDGALVKMYILFSVNHYDLRQERVVVLCARALLRVKVDFHAAPRPRVLRTARVDVVAIRRVELEVQDVLRLVPRVEVAERRGDPRVIGGGPRAPGRG